MKHEIRTPSVGESVVEATVGNIIKPSGAHVKVDDEILELETDKVNQVVYAPIEGVVHLEVKKGDVVKVGDKLGFIDTAAEAKTPTPEPSMDLEPQKPSPPKEPKKATAPTTKLTPTRSDEERKPMSKLRKVIAERLVQVKNETAMLTTFNEVDMSYVMAKREKEQASFQQKHGVKLGFMSFFIQAATSALKAWPAINARIEGDEIVYCHHYDIGVAVGTDKGLMVPVIRGADQLSAGHIEQKLKEYADKARNQTLAIDDMQGGTFTITNGGVYGSLLSTPILNPPQCAILGMHNIVKRPVVVDDQIVIRPMMYLALSYDHRIVDGKEAISFLVHIKQALESIT